MISIRLLAAACAVSANAGASEPHRLTSSTHEYRACGANCLFTVSRILGVEASLSQVETLLRPDKDGMNTLAELDAAAHAVGLASVPVRFDVDQLDRVPAPSILHVRQLEGMPEGNHFVVYLGRSAEGGAVWLDPPQTPTEFSAARARRRWTGHALACFRSEAEAQAFRAKLAPRDLWREPLVWSAFGMALATGFVAVRSGATTRAGKARARRPSWSTLVLAPVLLGLVGCGGSPKLVVPGQVLEFGFVPKSGKNFEIPISNQGTGVLKLYQINKSCECTVVEGPKELAPGETKRLVVRSQPIGGPAAVRLVLGSNDPKGPHEILFTYFGEAPPALDPPWLLIDDARPGEVVRRPVKLTYAGGDRRYKLEVKDVRISNPDFRLEHKQSDPQARTNTMPGPHERAVVGEETLEFTGRAPETPGSTKGDCKFTVVQAGERHELTLSVEIRAVGPLRARPASVLFSGATGDRIVGQKRTVLLTVAQAAGSPNVVSAPDSVGCTLEELAGGSAGRRLYRLAIEVTKKPPARSDRDGSSVIVQLPGDAKTRVAIPLRFAMLP